MSGIPFAAVKGNNWRKLPVSSIKDFKPTLQVSVVVAYYEAPEALALTMAALEGQTYPRELFEVVIVDDGSATPLVTPESPLDVQVVHQEDLGFGLARARNTGANAAKGEVLIFLDCDMMSESAWIAEHARWHHAASDVLTLGFRRHVEVDGIDVAGVRDRSGTLEDLFEGRPWERPEWIEGHMIRTNDLCDEVDDIFRPVTGGNLGVSKTFYDLAGGYDESFTQWGAEDTEFGYRAYTRGAVLVPAREALCWHQGAGAAPSSAEKRSLELQRAKISQLIAHRGFRKANPGRSFTVPQVLVLISLKRDGSESDTTDRSVIDSVAQDTTQLQRSSSIHLLSMVETLLGGSFHDLVIWICADDSVSDWLQRTLDGDPRVRFGTTAEALEAYGAASFHVHIPADVVVDFETVALLLRVLGTSTTAYVPLGENYEVRITRAWATHRQLRNAMALDELGSVVKATPHAVKVSIKGLADGTGSTKMADSGSNTKRLAALLPQTYLIRCVLGLSKRLIRVCFRVGQEALRIRDIAGAKRFWRWVVASWRSVLVNRVRDKGGPLPKARLWLRRKLQVDEGAQVNDLADLGGFDSALFNPVNWRVEHRRARTTSGISDRIFKRDINDANNPPEWFARQWRRLRRAHHVIDVGDYHADVDRRAQTLASLAATGAVVHLSDCGVETSQLRDLLGADLYGVMTSKRIAEADHHERELLSVEMRRIALREHSNAGRARKLAVETEDVDLYRRATPLVSVLLATKRPEQVVDAVAAVARQSYPRIELILALHGAGFEDVSDALKSFESDSGFGTERRHHVINVSETQNLGEVLAAATETSSGELVTKFDDDDHYGIDHLWDLVLAVEYSGAELVAKGSEYVYLKESDVLVHRFRGRGERHMTWGSIAGGAMMIARQQLDQVGGWSPVPKGVDQALIQSVLNYGGTIYRTHGAGYVLVRNASGHTWDAQDSYFLDQADEIKDGLDLEFAGIKT